MDFGIGNYMVRKMEIEEDQLLIELNVSNSMNDASIDGWLLIDGEGNQYVSHGSGNERNEQGEGSAYIYFNQPSMKGPFTLVALTSYQYVPLEKPVLIELR